MHVLNNYFNEIFPEYHYPAVQSAKEQSFNNEDIMNALIKFIPEWRSVPTTCAPCSVCEEIIYGNQYQMFLNNKPCDTILCGACYMEVEKEE